MCPTPGRSGRSARAGAGRHPLRGRSASRRLLIQESGRTSRVHVAVVGRQSSVTRRRADVRRCAMTLRDDIEAQRAEIAGLLSVQRTMRGWLQLDLDLRTRLSIAGMIARIDGWITEHQDVIRRLSVAGLSSRAAASMRQGWRVLSPAVGPATGRPFEAAFARIDQSGKRCHPAEPAFSRPAAESLAVSHSRNHTQSKTGAGAHV